MSKPDIEAIRQSPRQYVDLETVEALSDYAMLLEQQLAEREKQNFHWHNLSIGEEVMKTIQIEINCNKKTCGLCEYKTIRHTGLAGEFHPKCDIFPPYSGSWGTRNMNRCPECMEAERAARKP